MACPAVGVSGQTHQTQAGLSPDLSQLGDLAWAGDVDEMRAGGDGGRVDLIEIKRIEAKSLKRQSVLQEFEMRRVNDCEKLALGLCALKFCVQGVAIGHGTMLSQRATPPPPPISDRVCRQITAELQACLRSGPWDSR